MCAVVPEDVLIRELDGESVIFDLGRSEYFGLDGTGTRMLQALTAAASIEEAFAVLLSEFEVEPDVLRSDLVAFITSLKNERLLDLRDA
jgi:hypothetical protein